MANNFSEVSEERLRLEQVRLSYYKRRKKYGIITISLVFLLMVFFVLYHFTDVVFGPPEGLSAVSAVGEWAMFHHDLERTGNAGMSGVLPQGKLRWVFSTSGTIHSSPAVASGIVYICSWDSRLYALDAATGDKLWEFQTGAPIESSPAVKNGVVYFGSFDNFLRAADAETGRVLWKFPTGQYGNAVIPTLHNDVLYHVSRDGNMFALTLDGRQIWKYVNRYNFCVPIIHEDRIYVGS